MLEISRNPEQSAAFNYRFRATVVQLCCMCLHGGRLFALLRKQIVIIAWDDSRASGVSRPNKHSIQPLGIV